MNSIRENHEVDNTYYWDYWRCPPVLHRCPTCKRASAEMMPLEVSYELADKRRQEYKGFAPIAHEILQCPCGKMLTWAEMEQVSIEQSRDEPIDKLP